MAQRLQIEWLSLTIPQGELLSAPLALEEDASRPAPLAQDDAPRPASALEFFMVVDKWAGRKKAVRTAALSIDHMAMPVTLQAARRWQGGEEVYHDGCPLIADLTAIADWPVLRSGLRRWATGVASTAGCLSIGQSCAVVEAGAEEGWKSGVVTTLALLDALAARGWRRGQPPQEHSADSAKVFAVTDPLKRKTYLRCLVGLEALREVGQLNALRSDQSASYYACVLAAEKPACVPIGADSIVYADLLRGKVAPSQIADAESDAEAVEAARAPAALQDRGASSSSEAEMCGPSLGQGVKRKATPQRPRQPQKAGGASGGQDWGTLVAWQSEGSASPAAASGSGSGAAGGAVGPGAAQMDSADGPCAAASNTPAASARAQPSGPAASVAQPSCDILEGVSVFEESHGVADMPGSYRRLVVSCGHPDHAAHKLDCRKRRNFNVRSASASGLGLMEPYVFLGAWLRAASQHSDAASHKRFSPDAAAVRAYAVEHGWL